VAPSGAITWDNQQAQSPVGESVAPPCKTISRSKKTPARHPGPEMIEERTSPHGGLPDQLAADHIKRVSLWTVVSHLPVSKAGLCPTGNEVSDRKKPGWQTLSTPLRTTASQISYQVHKEAARTTSGK
jgi:hypothetical protein